MLTMILSNIDVDIDVPIWTLYICWNKVTCPSMYTRKLSSSSRVCYNCRLFL